MTNCTRSASRATATPGREPRRRLADERPAARPRQDGRGPGRGGHRPGRHAEAELKKALADGIAQVKAGKAVVLDVRVAPEYARAGSRRRCCGIFRREAEETVGQARPDHLIIRLSASDWAHAASRHDG